MTSALPRGVPLGTCAAINADRISVESRAAIAAAQSGPGVYVSPITAWEIATLAVRRRLILDTTPEQWFARLLALPGMRLAPMAPALLMASTGLPGDPPRDPADRIIAATARALDLTLITRDGELLPYGLAGHPHVLAC